MEQESDWLSHVRLYTVNEHEQHLYLGSPSEPRGSLVTIRGPRMSIPVRCPPISLSNLESRYPEDRIGISSPLIRLILILMGIHEGSVVVTKDEELLDTDNAIYATYWNKFTKTQKKFIPISEQLLESLSLPNGLTEESLVFLMILGEVDRNKRQSLLTELVKFETDTSNCLIYYLFNLRQELSIAIIREFGRHGVCQDYVIQRSKNYLEIQDKESQIFAYPYLRQFIPEFLPDHHLHLTWLFKAKSFLTLHPKFRLKSIVQKIQNSRREASESLNYLLVLEDTPDVVLKEIRFILPEILHQRLKNAQLYPLLIDLLQYAETRKSPLILALVTVMGSSIQSQPIEVNGLHLPGFSPDLNYLQRRIVSLIRIWKFKKYENDLIAFSSYFLQMLPDFGNRSNATILDIIEWSKVHPIMSEVHKNFTKVLNDENHIVDIAFHTAFSKNLMLRPIVVNYLSKNPIQERYTFEKEIVLRSLYASLVDISSEALRIVDRELIPSFIMDPSVLPIFAGVETAISRALFQELIPSLVNDSNETWSSLIEYLKVVSKIEKSLLDDYFEDLYRYLDSKYNHDQSNSQLEEFIITVILAWPQITGVFANEVTQHVIDSYKILLQDKLDNFDLETSKPLDIETIVRTYQLTNGQIPKFVEGNIQFSFTKPVWDQLARHYLALGIHRPQREIIAGSKLREVPGYLIRDVLGQIALVNQTLGYCERNGFRDSLENLIISNIYRRGWNVERGMERTLPALLGSASPRLRSYLSSYLVIDQGEISLDILQWARDVEDFALRDRIVRELERYGTADMWIVIANSYHQDIHQRGLKQIKETRMSSSERSKTIVGLLESTQKGSRKLGRTWLAEQGVQQDHLIRLFYNYHKDNLEDVISYLVDNMSHFDESHQQPLYELLVRILWMPLISQKVKELCTRLSSGLNHIELKEKLTKECLQIIQTHQRSRVYLAISLLEGLEVN